MYVAGTLLPAPSRRSVSTSSPLTETSASTTCSLSLAGMRNTALASARRGRMSNLASNSAPSGVGPISNLSPSRSASPIACAIPGADPDRAPARCSVMLSGCDPCATVLLHIATATPPPRYEEQRDFGGTVETGGEDACRAVEPQPVTTPTQAATNKRGRLFI